MNIPLSVVYILSILLLVLIGARFLGTGDFSKAKRTIKSNDKWLLLLPLGYIISSVANHLTVVTADHTTLASRFFGNLPAQIQASIQYSPLTMALSLLYLFSLPVILILTPLLLAKAGDAKSFRQFCLTILLAYIGLTFSHIFVPVTRPALYSGSGIMPLLYNYPVLGELTYLLGSRSLSFPSAHTTLIFATFILLIFERRYKRYSIIVGAVFLLIPFTVMYLGVHWPIDVIGGIVLGSLSVLAATVLLR